MLKWALSISLCLLIALPLGACKGNNQASSGNTISFGMQTSGTVQQQVLGPLGETWENNRFIKLYKDKLGVDVKYSWLVDTSQYFEKLSLQMSKGQLPDVCLVDTNRLYSIEAAGLIQPLDGIYEKNASADLKADFADAGDEIWDAATINGHLYGIPNLYSPLDRMQYVWIRTDWLKKLNLPEPKNFQDVLDIAAAFTKNDPDGDGKNDTYGFGMRGKPDLWREYYSFKGLFEAFGGLPPRLVADGSGNITKSEITQADKNALGQVAQLVADGEINPKFSTISDEQVTEEIAQNRVGMFFGEHYAPQMLLSSIYSKMKAASPDYDWKAYPIYDMQGNYAKQDTPLACNGWYVVRKGYQNPQTLIRMLNVFVEAIKENPDYYQDSATIKSIWSISPVSLLAYNANIDIYDKVNAILDGSTSYDSATQDIKTSADILRLWQSKQDPSAWGWHTIYDKDGAMGVLKQYVGNKALDPPDYYYEVPQSAENFGGVLDQLRDQYYLDVLLGKKKISDFDSFVSQWNSSGGQLMMGDINKIYQQEKAK